MKQMTTAEKQAYIRENIVEVQSVDGFTPCWIWQGKLSREGYGQSITLGKYTTTPHRHSYFAFAGSFSPMLDTDHLCYVRACVNPEHLEPVTRAENIRRSIEHAEATGAHGHRQPQEMCKAGLHKLEEPNLRWKTDRNGVKRRTCKTCAKANDRERYADKMALASLTP